MFLKRVLDLVISIIVLPIFVILLLIIGTIMFFYDKGNILYIAPRLGKDGKIFNMYKFRSMKMNAPDLRNNDGSTFSSESDARLTKIGGFLRKTSIDEIPQIINILKGNMSIIGPRPDLPEHLKLYVDQEKRKLEVKPGISGYNQAYYRNAIAWKERIKNDIYYIDNLTFLFDIKIIVKTIIVIFKRENVFSNEKEDKKYE